MSRIPTDPQSDVPTIGHHDLPDNAPLLDVREQDEWEAGHAPEAIHIPLSQLEDRVEEARAAAGDGRLVVTCKAGGRASRAVAFLREHDIDAVNLEGGMGAWHASNRPMSTNGHGCPSVL